MNKKSYFNFFMTEVPIIYQPIDLQGIFPNVYKKFDCFKWIKVRTVRQNKTWYFIA